MIFKLAHYVFRSLLRQRTRTFLTIGGIATAMFLFSFIEGLQSGVRDATENEATKNVLIVYQKSRFCPSSSSLPERYAGQISEIPGVNQVIPIKIYINNCRASLDSVTFRGISPDLLISGDKPLRLTEGSMDAFTKKSDAAIVGAQLARRRGLQIGERFQIGSVAVEVVGIFESDVPGEGNVAYTQLEFLQRGQGVNSLGRVTQFEVKIDDASKAAAVSTQIDQMFRADEIQTSTKSHKAFVNSATGDLLSLVRFTRMLGIMCVLVVLALTANTIYMMVQDRVREHAVLQTLGFRGIHLFSMVLCESLLLSLAGGALGTAAAAALLYSGRLGLGAEGVTISFILTPAVIAAGLLVSTAAGLFAGLAPAVHAAFAPIVDSLRRA